MAGLRCLRAFKLVAYYTDVPADIRRVLVATVT